MNRTTRIGVVAALAAMLSVAAWAASGPENDGLGSAPGRRMESKERRDSLFEKHVARLPPEEQRLERAMRPLMDSMMRLTRDYRRKAKDGADPRSLTAERAAIVSLDAQIQKTRAENREAWLDMLARTGVPVGPDGPMHHRRPHHQDGSDQRSGPNGPESDNPPPGPDCPMMHGDDGMPPPED